MFPPGALLDELGVVAALGRLFPSGNICLNQKGTEKNEKSEESSPQNDVLDAPTGRFKTY